MPSAVLLPECAPTAAPPTTASSSPPPTTATLDDDLVLPPPGEAWSLQEILRANERIKLFQEPYAWTHERHLRAMGCRFEDEVTDLDPDAAAGKMEGWDEALRHDGAECHCRPCRARKMIAALRSDASKFRKTAALHVLLVFPETKLFGSLTSVEFLYDGEEMFELCNKTWTLTPPRPVATEEEQTLLPAAAAAGVQAPHVAYVDLTHEAAIRHDCVWVRTNPEREDDGEAANMPMVWYREIRQKLLRLRDPLQNPYVAALLIAMALKQREGGVRPHVHYWEQPWVEQTYRARVVATRDEEPQHMFVYTADVANAYLDKFRHAKQRPAWHCDMAIRTARIPYDPESTFRSRLHAALVEEPDMHGAGGYDSSAEGSSSVGQPDWDEDSVWGEPSTAETEGTCFG